jgi:drug/metabolite transporter (DMT)-like permease
MIGVPHHEALYNVILMTINTKNMKKTGIILIVIGVLLTLFTSFGFFTKKKVVDLGRLEITKNEPHRVKWSPYIGIALILAGGIFTFVGAKSKGWFVERKKL